MSETKMFGVFELKKIDNRYCPSRKYGGLFLSRSGYALSILQKAASYTDPTLVTYLMILSPGFGRFMNNDLNAGAKVFGGQYCIENATPEQAEETFLKLEEMEPIPLVKTNPFGLLQVLQENPDMTSGDKVREAIEGKIQTKEWGVFTLENRQYDDCIWSRRYILPNGYGVMIGQACSWAEKNLVKLGIYSPDGLGRMIGNSHLCDLFGVWGSDRRFHAFSVRMAEEVFREVAAYRRSPEWRENLLQINKGWIDPRDVYEQLARKQTERGAQPEQIEKDKAIKRLMRSYERACSLGI